MRIAFRDHTLGYVVCVMNALLIFLIDLRMTEPHARCDGAEHSRRTTSVAHLFQLPFEAG